MDMEIHGGTPIIRDTRTPVRSVIELLRIHNNDVGEVGRALAHLNAEEIRAAIAYYHDNPTLVDEDIRRQQEALERFLARA
jgi:uncharacterized protein (DUF433 family)